MSDTVTLKLLHKPVGGDALVQLREAQIARKDVAYSTALLNYVGGMPTENGFYAVEIVDPDTNTATIAFSFGVADLEAAHGE